MALQNKSGISETKRVTVSFSDSIDLANEQVQWTPKGVSLMTKWHFAEGVEVEFAFDHQGESLSLVCHFVNRRVALRPSFILSRRRAPSCIRRRANAISRGTATCLPITIRPASGDRSLFGSKVL